MSTLRRWLSLLAAVSLLGAAWGVLPPAGADDKKDAEKKDGDKKDAEQKSGTVTGTVTAKDKNWVEVKADGEEKGRRYFPQWVGGQPKDGGGPDKDIVKAIGELTVGSRVRIEWKFNERPRVVKIEVLKAAEKKDTDK
jgi:hypothetical protein